MASSLLRLLPLLFLVVPAPAIGAEPVRVGVVLPLTGPFAPNGEIEKLSFLMAEEEINAAGGIGGRPIRFLIEDTASTPEGGRAAAEKLITEENVVMLGGGYSSSVTMAVAEVAVDRGFPFLINTASADSLTRPTAYTPAGRRADDLRARQAATEGWENETLARRIALLDEQSRREAARYADRFPLFRLNPPASEYSSGIENFLAAAVEPKTAAIIYENSPDGVRQKEAFEKIARAVGAEVALRAGYDAGAVDFKPLLSTIKSLSPDLICLASRVIDASLMMRQSMELAMNPKLFVGGAAGFARPAFARSAGIAGRFVVSGLLWNRWLPLPGAREYADRFRETWRRETDYHGVEAYAAAHVIADALRRADDFEKRSVIASLEATDLTTPLGPVTFVSYDRMVHQNRMETYVVQWIDGAMKLVWPKSLADADYVYPIDWVATRR